MAKLPDLNIPVPRGGDILEPDVHFRILIVNRCATQFHKAVINNIVCRVYNISNYVFAPQINIIMMIHVVAQKQKK